MAADRNKGGRPPHAPTDHDRKRVALHAGLGVPIEQIARIVGIAKETLIKHYGDELELGRAQATASIAGKLYERAMKGDVACMIFWLKAQAGWSERMQLDAGTGTQVVFKISKDDEKL